MKEVPSGSDNEWGFTVIVGAHQYQLIDGKIHISPMIPADLTIEEDMAWIRARWEEAVCEIASTYQVIFKMRDEIRQLKGER